jgi:hypothetical protein
LIIFVYGYPKGGFEWAVPPGFKGSPKAEANSPVCWVTWRVESGAVPALLGTERHFTPLTPPFNNPNHPKKNPKIKAKIKQKHLFFLFFYPHSSQRRNMILY